MVPPPLLQRQVEHIRNPPKDMSFSPEFMLIAARPPLS